MKFSVVIPVYNGETYLPRTLKCLQQQDFADWEAIVVDDGSPDRSPMIADEFAHADDRIRVIHQINGGVSCARNRGMDEARGDWIVWLDQDDVFVPGAFKKLEDLTTAHPDCNCLQFPCFEAGPTVASHPRISAAYAKFGDRCYSGPDAFDVLFARPGSGGMNWETWRFVFRRDSLPRFRPGVFHEDLDVLPLHLATLHRVFISKTQLYVHFLRQTGAATETFTPYRVWDILDVTAHVYAELERSGLDDTVKSGFMAVLAYNLFGYYLATSRFSEPDRTKLLAVFSEHREWLYAIARPRHTAWLKKLLLNILGVRRTALLVGKFVSLHEAHRRRP